MAKPNQKRFDFRCPNLECGHEFSRRLTTQQFIDNDHRCPKCDAKAKRAILSAGCKSGVVVPGLRVEYPYYNPSLPILPGQKPGEQVVMSRSHEREIMSGAWGNSGQRWERNAI